MTTLQVSQQLTRDAILNLLTDTEAARVSSAEATETLKVGSEFLDLMNIEAGVQTLAIDTMVTVAHVLPRQAVSDATWTKVVAALKH